MNYRFNIRVIVLLLLLYFPSISYSQQELVYQKASNLIEKFMSKNTVPGIAVSIGINGQIAWSNGFGFANVEQRVPIWPALTEFRIGSVAKPMTAVAIAQLYEKKMLDLDAPVQRYVPTFPKKQGTITTRLLAGHLSGIRHYKNIDEFLNKKHYYSVMEGLTIFQNDPLLSTPGTKFLYSSYGYNLISAIIESVSKQGYLSYMDKNVLKNIGMKHTVADNVYSIIPNRTSYYELQDGHLVKAPYVDNSYKWASGGYLSTSEDLVRFGNAHLLPGLLKPETINLLWTSQQTTSGETTGYGIGWRIGTDKHGHRWVEHGGTSVGGSTYFIIYPDSSLVIAILANRSVVDYGELPQKIADLFLN